MHKAVFLLLPAVLLAGCKSSDIADRKRPDEFAIGKQAPLVILADATSDPDATPRARTHVSRSAGSDTANDQPRASAATNAIRSASGW